MIVSHHRSFVFIHNPKCSGKLFRDEVSAYHDDDRLFWGIQTPALLSVELDFAHLRLWEMQAVCPDIFDMVRTRRSLMFFRNPVERYVSAVFEHFAQYRAEADLRSQPLEVQKKIVRDFTAGLTIKQVLEDYRYVHFSVQRWFSHLGPHRAVNAIVPLLIGFEACRTAFTILELPDRCIDMDPRRTRAAEILGDAMLGRVRDFYAADYRLCQELDHLSALSEP